MDPEQPTVFDQANRILEYVEAHDGGTPRDIAEALGLEVEDVKAQLWILEQAGLIKGAG